MLTILNINDKQDTELRKLHRSHNTGLTLTQFMCEVYHDLDGTVYVTIDGEQVGVDRKGKLRRET